MLRHLLLISRDLLKRAVNRTHIYQKRPTCIKRDLYKFKEAYIYQKRPIKKTFTSCCVSKENYYKDLYIMLRHLLLVLEERERKRERKREKEFKKESKRERAREKERERKRQRKRENEFKKESKRERASV